MLGYRNAKALRENNNKEGRIDSRKAAEALKELEDLISGFMAHASDKHLCLNCAFLREYGNYFA